MPEKKNVEKKRKKALTATQWFINIKQIRPIVSRLCTWYSAIVAQNSIIFYIFVHKSINLGHYPFPSSTFTLNKHQFECVCSIQLAYLCILDHEHISVVLHHHPAAQLQPVDNVLPIYPNWMLLIRIPCNVCYSRCLRPFLYAVSSSLSLLLWSVSYTAAWDLWIIWLFPSYSVANICNIESDGSRVKRISFCFVFPYRLVSLLPILCLHFVCAVSFWVDRLTIRVEIEFIFNNLSAIILPPFLQFNWLAREQV